MAMKQNPAVWNGGNRRAFIPKSVAATAAAARASSAEEASGLTGSRDLRCESLSNFLGVDTPEPQLSWKLDDVRRGARQTAYRILAASSPDNLAQDQGDLWDSGKVASDQSHLVEYVGQPIESGQFVQWKVKVWDKDGCESPWSKPSSFSLGLLRDTDWKAQWITAPVFLTDSPIHVGYMSLQTEDPTDQKWVQIDLGETRKFETIRLHPACGRRGAFPPGGEIQPGDGFPVRFKIEAADREDMIESRMVVDFSHTDVANPGKEPYVVHFPETSARFVRLTAWGRRSVYFGGKSCLLKLAGMEILGGENDLARGCKVTALNSTEDVSVGYGASLLTAGRTCYDAGQRRRLRPSPLLRGEFDCPKPVSRAIAYATALGNYELHINGARIGDPHLAPGYTQYEKRVAVQAFDVTDRLRSGTNVAGAVLGDGWYRSRYRLDGHDQFKDFAQGRFGDAIPRFLLQIEIEYSDGTRGTVGTDGRWLCTMEGPYRKTSMYDGVVYDARRDMSGWSNPGFPCEGWTSAVISNPAWAPYRWPQTIQSIARTGEFKPVSMEKTKRGTLLCDFGQGVGGVCRVTLDGPKGTTVKLHHAMSLNPDGTLYTTNLWGAASNGDIYTLGGNGPQTFEAPFTFHGFRYVEISGLDSASDLKEITAVMISDDCALTATLETSDARLNKLWLATQMTFQSCLKSVMADVADRDERWGWFGDCGTIGAQAMAYCFDTAAYFRKRCLDLMDDQANSPEGHFPVKSPEMDGGSPAAVWSDGALTMAWASWVNYGNTRLLREVYPAIRKCIHLLKSNYASGKPLWPGHFGDWLSSEMTIRPDATEWTSKGPMQLPQELMQKINLVYVGHLFSRIANALDEREESASMDAFVNTIKCDPLIVGLCDKEPEFGAQSAYALSLGWEAAEQDKRPLLMKRLLKAIEAYGGHLATGSVATTTLLNVLSENGQHELAYRLAMKPEFPSFGFMVDHGATTIWERFDSWMPGLGYNPDPMNGLNHMGFCSIGEWMVSHIGGIRPDPAHPGYKHFFIAPKLGGGLTFMKASYESVFGMIDSAYEIGNGKLTLHITVPPNSTATALIPTTKAAGIRESGKLLAEAGLKTEPGPHNTTQCELPAGSYRFDFQVSRNSSAEGDTKK